MSAKGASRGSLLGDGYPRVYYAYEIHLRRRPFLRAGSICYYAGAWILFKRCVRTYSSYAYVYHVGHWAPKDFRQATRESGTARDNDAITPYRCARGICTLDPAENFRAESGARRVIATARTNPCKGVSDDCLVKRTPVNLHFNSSCGRGNVVG